MIDNTLTVILSCSEGSRLQSLTKRRAKPSVPFGGKWVGFQNVYIDESSIVEDSVLFDNVKVGKNVKRFKCIFEKSIAIPDGEEIDYDLKKDRQRFTVTNNNIVLVPQGYSFEESSN